MPKIKNYLRRLAPGFILIAALALPAAFSLIPTRPPALTRSGQNPPARLSENQAIARAVNKLTPTADGFSLRHPRHRADFTPQGVAFRPRRGGLDWQWQFAYAGTKTQPLAAVAHGQARPVQSEPGVIGYARGPIVERYVAHAGSVEQQFVIPEKLELGEADLTVAGRVASDGEFEKTDKGWQWRSAEGAVTLGDVTVIAADGARIPARMEVEADRTRIEVDGRALAAAAYPVVIDPEIGANDFRISDMGPDGDPELDAFDPSVAYNSATNEYLVVWEGDDNPAANDEFEIYGQRINAATGTELGGDFRISDMGPDGDPDFDASSPDIAYNSTNNEYLVVWFGNEFIPPQKAGEPEIYGQRLSATGSPIGANDFRISDMGPDGDPAFQAIDPAVAYNSTGNEYLVVWHGSDNADPLENEIYGQRLNAATGAEMGANDFRISDAGPDGDPDYDAVSPDVAYNSAGNQYLVAWHADDNTALLVEGESEIFGQLLNAGGGEIGANDFRISDMGPDGDSNFDAFGAVIAYNRMDNEYLVIWFGDDNTAPLVDDENEIFGQRLGAGGAQMGTNDFRISDMGPDGDPNYDALAHAVVYNPTNNEYLVVWQGDDNTAPLVDDEFEVFGQRLDAATGAQVFDNDFRVSDMGPDSDPFYGVGVPAVTYSSGPNQYLAVWSGDDDTGLLVEDEFEIYGQRLSARTGDTGGVFRPSNGVFFLKNQQDDGFADVILSYGLPGDVPIAGDWNGDGVDTIGVYRNGTFLLRNSNTPGFADIIVTFGIPSDVPIVGDWNNDGIDTIGVFRNGTFYLRNSNVEGAPDIVVDYGIIGDLPLAGDWNGDGFDTVGVFRPSGATFFLKNDNLPGFGSIVLVYGLMSDVPIVGDWNDDGIDTIGVFRDGAFLLRNSNTDGFAELIFRLGNVGDRPIAGDWDGLP